VQVVAGCQQEDSLYASSSEAVRTCPGCGITDAFDLPIRMAIEQPGYIGAQVFSAFAVTVKPGKCARGD
jgi:hypothetical protein